MVIEEPCPECGAPMPEDLAMNLCPRCLLKRGLNPETVGGTVLGGNQIPDPLLPEALASHFPQLQILGEIGHGGMGVVYKARQQSLDRIVALKLLRPGAESDPTFADRFIREARALARLNHPNIVGIHDFGAAGRYCHLIMEFVDGCTLRQLIRERALSPAQALSLIPQICDALQYAHDQGIVHRDIKPENILIDRCGRVKIADFGLAKIRTRTSADPTLTRTEHAMGTPHYIAPEQVRDSAEVDHRADIYSLGVMFYEMLTGELPMGHFPPPSERAAIDARLDAVVLKSLEREPDRRYQHASDVKLDLEEIARGNRPAASAAVPSGRTMTRRITDWLIELVLFAPPLLLLVVFFNGLMISYYRVIRPVWLFNAVPSITSTANIFLEATIGFFGILLLIFHVRGWCRTRVPLIYAGALLLAVGGAHVYRLSSSPLLVTRAVSGFGGYLHYGPADRLTICMNDGSLVEYDPLIDRHGTSVRSEHRGNELLDVSADRTRAIVRRDRRDTLELMDLKSGCSVKTYSFPSQTMPSSAFSPDSKRLAIVASARHDSQTGQFVKPESTCLMIYSAIDGSLLSREETPQLSPGWEQAVDWRGDLLAVADCYDAGTRGVLVWNVAEHRKVHYLVHPEYQCGPLSVRISPDQTVLAVGYAPYDVGLYDLQTGKLKHLLASQNNWVVCLDFSPDSKLLASGEGNSAVRLWDVASGRQLRCLGMGPENSSNYTYSLSFDSTGQHLACGAASGHVVIWNVP